MKTFLKAFSTKLTLVMLALASMATSAMAEVRLSFEDISLFLGTSAPVTVLMDNDEADVTNLQFDITLPENVTLDEATIQENSSILSASQGFRWAKQADGAYRFVITSSTRDGFVAPKGALLTFNVTAAEGVAEGAVPTGACTRTISNVSMSLCQEVVCALAVKATIAASEAKKCFISVSI